MVYLARNSSTWIYELYLKPLGGASESGSMRPPGTGRQIEDFAVSPDGSRVVYREMRIKANENDNTNRSEELYSVPVGSDEAVRLSRPLPGDGGVFDFKISPDSRRVVYVGEQDTDGVVEAASECLKA